MATDLQSSPKDYLETALKPVPGSTPAAQAKNQVTLPMRRKLAGGMPIADWSPAMLLQIRASIKALFPNRDCFTLVRPMSDERQLNQLESIDASKYRPEFNKVSAACWEPGGAVCSHLGSACSSAFSQLMVCCRCSHTPHWSREAMTW